jgi:cytidyltransferase-like protein
MNQLTRLLVKETLGEQKIIALYGGSFKPPTKGHFNVVKETLQKYPEIDELIVYVGSGERDGVTQEESVKIWEIYKNYLSPKVIIEPTISPIKTILDYSKVSLTSSLVS